MDTHEFDFPPDQVSSDVRSPSLHSMAATVPFGILVRAPVEELPPTPAPATPHCTIGQLLRGGLHSHASRTSHAANAAAGMMPGRATPPRSVVESDDFSMDEPTGSAHHSTRHDRSAALSDLAELRQEKRAGDAHPPSASAPHTSDPDAEGGSQHHDVSTSDNANGAPRSGLQRYQRLEWTEKEVRDFYKALSQFGTDFGAIAVLFPHRERNQVKKLYQREYRKHRADVLHALEHKEEIDVDAYQQLLAERKALEAPKKKKLAVSEEELLNEIASGAVAAAVPATGETVDAIESANDSYTDFTVAEFVNETTNPTASTPHGAAAKKRGTSPTTTRKRTRDQHDEDSVDVSASDGRGGSNRTTEKRPRHQRPSATSPHEETLFDMMVREDDQFANQTLLEAALDGEFGAVFPAENEPGSTDEADDFTF